MDNQDLKKFEDVTSRLKAAFALRAKKMAGYMAPTGHDRAFRTGMLLFEVNRDRELFFLELRKIVGEGKTADIAETPQVYIGFAKPAKWGDDLKDFEVYLFFGETDECLALVEEFIKAFPDLRSVSYGDWNVYE